MFNRDNAIGVVLLGLCAVVAGYMLYAIVTGRSIQLHISNSIGTLLGVAFIGLLIFGFVSSGGFRRFGRRGRQWPDPNTGQRSWWDRLRGR